VGPLDEEQKQICICDVPETTRREFPVHARIATYRGASAGDLAVFLPQLEARVQRDLDEPPPGLEGLREILVLVDREQGRALAVTFFDSEDDLNRGDKALDRVAMTQAGGVRTEVERYEVALRRSQS
jgi:hypothetical protein